VITNIIGDFATLDEAEAAIDKELIRRYQAKKKDKRP